MFKYKVSMFNFKIIEAFTCGEGQHGKRNLPVVSIADWQWKLNPRPFVLESIALMLCN